MKKTALSLITGWLTLGALTVSASSLVDIYELALQNDPQLKADRAAYEAGLETRNIGRAGLLPQINLQGTYQRDEVEGGTPPITDDQIQRAQNRDSTTWTLSLNQPLFNMSAWYSYQQGSKLSEVAEAEFGADQQDLIVRVADAYFNVLRAIENLETALAEERALEQQLEQTQQRYEVGLTSITEVHEARSVYDNATATTFQARGDLGIAYEALEVLTGRSHDRIAPLADNFPVVAPEPTDRHQWVEFALQNNYQLRAASLAADASRQNARAARAEHYPTLSGNARYIRTDTSGFGFSDDVDGPVFGVTLDVPLFSGGATSAQRRQASAQHLQSRELANSTQRNVIQSTRALHLSVITGVSQVRAREQAIVSAESALEATQSGYEVGTRNLVEVLLAQRAVYEARRNYSNSLYDYIINTIRLREVAGMLTPADVQEIDRWLQAQSPVRRSEYDDAEGYYR